MQPDTGTNDTGAPQPQKWWQRTPKFYIVIGLVVVVALVVAVVAPGGRSGNKGGKQSTTAVYYDRPGFDRKHLSSGIGDPAALGLKKNAQPAVYQNANIVQACSVFGLDDIRATGVRLRPHNLTVAFTRNYLDGKGKGLLRPSDGILPPLGDESNNCQFSLVDANGEPETLWIEVFQPPYAPATALDANIARMQNAGQISGLKAYQSSRQAADIITTKILMRSGDSAVQVTSSIRDKAKEQAVAEKAAANFNRLLAAPEGPPKVTFDSPLMPGTALNACDLLLDGDVVSIFGEPASPIVGEASTTAVAVIRFKDGGAQHNYVIHECERGVPRSEADIFSLNARILKLKATTYRNLAGAQEEVLFHKAQDKKVAAVSAKVGDEAFFSSGIGGNDEELIVRKGRFVLRFSNQDKKGTKDTVISLAQTVVGRIK